MPKDIFVKIDGIGTCLTPDYAGSVVEIYETEGQAYEETLAASITTKRCLMFSVGQKNRMPEQQEKPSEMDFYNKLFGDAENMKMYERGIPIPENEIKSRYDEACKLWGEKNPFSSFFIEDNETGEYVGQNEMIDTIMPNTCEYGIAIDKKYWRKGIGTEVTVAHSYFWTTYLRENGYNVNENQILDTIYGTADPKNGTAKIFRDSNYTLADTFEHPKYGLREKFTLSVQEASVVRDNTKKLQLK